MKNKITVRRGMKEIGEAQIQDSQERDLHGLKDDQDSINGDRGNFWPW
jgi:endonuclease I